MSNEFLVIDIEDTKALRREMELLAQRLKVDNSLPLEREPLEYEDEDAFIHWGEDE